MEIPVTPAPSEDVHDLSIIDSIQGKSFIFHYKKVQLVSGPELQNILPEIES